MAATLTTDLATLATSTTKATTNNLEYSKALGTAVADLGLTIQIVSISAFNSPGTTPTATPCIALNTAGTSATVFAVNVTGVSTAWHPFTATA